MTTQNRQETAYPKRPADTVCLGAKSLLFVLVASPAVAVWGAFPSIPEAGADSGHSQAPAWAQGQTEQKECPVMIGNKIDPNLYEDYKGKRVLFCSQSCKTAFAKAPQRYLSRLAQFASVQADAGHQEHEHANHAHEFSLISLAEPAGILTLSLVALTVCLGLLRRVRRLRPRLLLKLHKIAGICALCSGAIHATIVLLTH